MKPSCPAPLHGPARRARLAGRCGVALLLGLLLGLSASLPAHAAPKKKKGSAGASQTTRRARRPAAPAVHIPVVPNLPPNGEVPQTTAEAVLIRDAVNGNVLYERNADQLRAPASTQKLLTALIIVESGDLERAVTIQPGDTMAEPTKLGVKAGETYTRRQLLCALLVHSVNDGAHALARDNAGSVEAFAAKMNRKAQELGMRNSRFVNPNGLPAPGQYSTARDLSRLAMAAYRSPTIRAIACTRAMNFRFNDGRVVEYKNTNFLLHDYPWCNGLKTGYTAAAGHCLITSGSKDGRQAIAVVLGEKKRDWLWQDSCSLLAWGLQRAVVWAPGRQ